MGSWFSNLQIRLTEPEHPFAADRIADLLTQTLDLSLTDKNDADIAITILIPENSQWLTVTSDLIDGNTDSLLHAAKNISEELKTEVLAISCFDSDYLFLNLIDFQNELDAWASCGRYPDGKAPRKSNFNAWKTHVSDASAFRRIMRAKYILAEECLSAIEPLLSLPVVQSMCTSEDEPDCGEIRNYYFKYNQKDPSVRPPVFDLLSYSSYFDVGDEKNGSNLISFLNKGAASRGVAVFLTGPCITEHQVEVTSVSLQFRDNHDNWNFLPVDIRMTTFDNGLTGFYGECPDIRIPPAVSENLPWQRKMQLEHQRSISVRFTLSAAVPGSPSDKQFDLLQVSLVPLENFSGQSGLVLKHRSACPPFPRIR